MREHESEIRAGQRFEFGKNWQGFVELVDEDRIELAKASLREYLGELTGKTFLDIGSGSGLFSLAARQLGAEVKSFDYDSASVAATRALRERYCPGDPHWTVLGEGSVLDRRFLASLGRFDIVYSWGVLHHTGAMWTALANVVELLQQGGLLFISIYNHQGLYSRFNARMKRAYVGSGALVRTLIVASFAAFQLSKGLVEDLALSRNPLGRYAQRKQARGMSLWHDWIDWVGGYPFQVAKPEEIFYFFDERGFRLCKLQTCGAGHGCNQFVFRYEAARPED